MSDNNTLDITEPAAVASGEQLRDRSAHKAWDHEDAAWKIRAWQALNELRATKQPFNADDVAEKAGRPKKPGAMGALFLQAVKEHLIHCVGYVKMRQPRAHARRTAVYTGC